MTTTHNFSYQVASIVIAAVAVLGFAGSALAHEESNSSGTGVEVNLGTNGSALVRGAKVTSVSSTTVNANTSWGSTVLGWVVKTDSNTDIVNKNGNDTTIADIAVGDIVSFRGTIDQTVSGLTVKAKSLKDWSKIEAKTKLNGTVTSINSTLGSFTIKNGNSTTTVQTSSSTKFMDDGDSGTFADIVLNAKVKLKGMFNASSPIFTATEVDVEDNDNTADTWNKSDKKAWREWIHSKVWLKLGFND